MKRLTMEEAKALDDLLTETDPEFTNIPGVFAKQHNLLDALDLYKDEIKPVEGVNR